MSASPAPATPTLSALLRRRAGEGPAVRPRPRSRFEGDDDGELTVVDEERVAALPPATHHAAVVPTPPGPTAAVADAALAPAHDVPDSPPSSPPAPPPDAAPDQLGTPQAPPAAPVTRTSTGDREVAVPGQPARATAPGSGAARVREGNGHAAAAAPGAPQPADVGVTVATPAPSPETAAVLPDSAPGSSRTATETTTDGSWAERPQVRSRRATVPTTPTVEVRIGRVVVDARPPAPPAVVRRTRTATSPPRPGPDLEAYLDGGAP